MMIHDVNEGIQKNKRKKRVGRGPGSGHGKTAGRGHKGDGSRSGYSRRRGYEGGQTPFFQRVAKRGFSNARWAKTVAIINVSQIENVFESGEEVTPETLKTKGLLKGRFDLVKVLGNGELSKKVSVKVHRISRSAAAKVEQAGGSVELILL